KVRTNSQQVNQITGAIVTGSDLNLSPLFSSNGLVGYWKFDEGQGTSTQDSSGNGNGGTLGGSIDLPTWQSNCQVGGCLSFDGTDDYVSVPVFTSIDTGSFTIMHWFKLSTTGKDEGSVGKSAPYNLNNPGYAIRFLASGNNIGTDINISSGTGAQSTISYKWNTSTWHYIAWVVNRIIGTYDIYIDGQDVASGTGIPTTGSTAIASSLNFGNGGNSAWFTLGSLDDIRIYNRALSAAEVMALYNATK
ncbi:MAG TPA: LamG domain-containing protein, partial [Candidatus Paceibacterota bacterium]|nr:LamG domain-containing protein [Candidatus Paceibacterota bacterium]